MKNGRALGVPKVDFGLILILSGLLLELLAGFVMATEAIGIPTVQTWIRNLSVLQDSEIKTYQELAARGQKRLYYARTIFYFIGAEVSAFLGLLYWERTGLTFFGILSAVVFAVLVTEAMRGLLLVVIKLMIVAEKWTDRRQAGIAGFLLLALGIGMEFSGVLMQSFKAD